MKVLKILGIILALLIVGYLVACAMGDKQVEVKRTVTINSPVADVWSHVSSLQAQEAWSPWGENDPSNTVTFSGDAGTVGSSSAWKGDSTGVGTQKITEIVPNEKVVNHLTFIEPEEMAGEADAVITLKENGDKTEASWSFIVDMPFMGRPFASAAKTGIDAGVGGPFEKGLNNLKKMCESSFNGYAIKTSNTAEQTYIGKRSVVSVEQLATTFGQVFPAVAGALGAAGVAPEGMPVSIAYSWDEEKGETDIMAAMPVPAGTQIDGFETVVIPAQKAGTIDYYGKYEDVGPAHHAMELYMKANGIAPQWPVMEQYITDPGQEPDPSKWLTKVTYLFGN